MNESYFSNLSSVEEFVLKCDIAGLGVKDGLSMLSIGTSETSSSIGKVRYAGICRRIAFFKDYSLIEDASDLTIEGDFDCSDMNLMSFDGFPKEIKGKLKCAHNDFVSLDKIPLCNGFDNNAFYYNKRLKTANIRPGVISIGRSAFSGCSGLESVTIPPSVVSIGYSAFYDCSMLKSVTLPSSVTSISCGAFSRCNGLTSVTIPSSVTSIGNGAFYDCSGLESITIPSSVTNIDNGAFMWCKELESVTIPSSVTSIGIGAFGSCRKLSLKFENPNFKSMENYPWGLKEEQISAV